MQILYQNSPAEGYKTIYVRDWALCPEEKETGKGLLPQVRTLEGGERCVYTGYPQPGAILALRRFFQEEGRREKEGCQILLDLPDLTGPQRARLADLIVLSLYQGAYRFEKESLRNWKPEMLYRERDRLASYGNAAFVLVAEQNLQAAVDRAVLTARCIGYARSLGNLPHNYLAIPDMVCYAREMAKEWGLSCKILDQAQLEELGCGGILAVNQGSANPAAMIILEWGKAGSGRAKTALVGKGLLFDSGGYHLKSIDGMKGMHFDMCGAANLLETMEMAARLGYEGELMAALPLAENLISPEAVKMGDVIWTMAGKSVEVYNTDAEGRLVLCDGLTYVQRCNATRVLDLATLTYSCHSALGDETVGVFSNQDELFDDFKAAMERTGERCWRLPLDVVYREALCWSDTAQLANYAPGKGAGASMAACFLECFIEPGTEWLHLDVVGPAVLRKENAGQAGGATGVCMAAIRDWLTQMGAKS